MRVDAYNGLIWEYYGSNNDSALYYGNQSIQLAKKIGYKKGLSNAHRYTGNVYELMTNYAKALYHQQLSLEIAEEIQFKPAIASSLSNIGSVYERIGDYKKALDFLERSLQLCVELDQKEGIAAVYGNIGNIYYNIKAYSKSLECYEKSLEINEQLQNPYGIAVSLGNIGNIYIDKKEFSKGAEYHERSLELRKQIGHRQGMASSMASLGICYFRMGDIAKAKNYFAEATVIANEIHDIISGMKAAKGLYEIHKEKSEFKDALFYHEEYFRLNDSIFSANRNEEMNNLRTKFALDQQQKELDRIAEQEKLKLQAKADADHQQQQMIIYFSIAALLIVLVFSAFLYNRFSITKRQKKIIEQQKSLVEEKNKQITDSINYAKRIQTAILPGEGDLQNLFRDSFLLFMPKDIVSGDFYWMSKIDKNRTIIATADSTGHGVPGGFMSMLGTSFLNEIVNEKGIHQPSSILNALREKIMHALKQHGQAGENKDGMDIVVCLYDQENHQLHYAAANNNFYLIRNNSITELKADKMPIGYFTEQQDPFNGSSIALEKGDMIVTFTDGYADQFGGPNGKKFKYSQFEELLLQISNEPSHVQRKRLEKTISEWKGDLEQIDDICVIGIKYT